jgi:hypothetical protein
MLWKLPVNGSFFLLQGGENLKHKLKIMGRTLFCLILILSMVAPSLTSLAYTRPSTENAVTYATTVQYPDIKDYGNIIAVSLMEVDNSAKTKYQDAITAHNINSSDSVWSDMSVSIVDQYLYDYPVDRLEKVTLSNSAMIITNWTKKSNTFYINGSSQPGKTTSEKVSRNLIYKASDYTAATSFKTMDITRTAILSNDTYYSAFQNKSLDVATVRSIAEANSGELEKWKKNFVSLWYSDRIGSADDILNGMFSDDEDSYYDNCLKYLDLMIVIASLTNDYDDSWDCIEKYLNRLNQDGSDTFVTIAAISCALLPASKASTCVVTPLPTYMAITTGRDISLFSHIERDGSTGSPIELNNPSISYGSNPSAYVSDIKSKYTSYKAIDAYKSIDSYNYWWGGSSGSNYALTLFPTDLNGNATGNCSYTFLALQFYENIPIPPVKIIKPAEDIPIETSPLGQFSIEATSDDFDVEAGTSVSAEFHIDLKLTASQRQTIRQLYQTQKTATATEVTKR